jgi:hypothetical protein
MVASSVAGHTDRSNSQIHELVAVYSNDKILRMLLLLKNPARILLFGIVQKMSALQSKIISFPDPKPLSTSSGSAGIA